MVVKVQSATLYEWMHEPRDPNHIQWAYNALDSAVTLRVHHALAPMIAASPHAQSSYALVRAMQGPALAMMRRGVLINAKVRSDETLRLNAKRARAQELLDRLANAVWGPETYVVRTKTKEVFERFGKNGKRLQPGTRTNVVESYQTRPRGLNAKSSKQVMAFFNIALGFPVEYEIRRTPNGTERTPTANDRALRKWGERRTRGPGIDPRDRTVASIHLASPFVSLILTIREVDKLLEVLSAPLDPDGRMRCSYNVAGTENGRWSSSKNAFGRGTNLQNITPEMRRMFCADEGQIFISTDLEQAESRDVAGEVFAATGDLSYWLACESSDLHTTVCRMAWPELGWTGDVRSDRLLAESRYPNLGGFTYRDVAKRLGHGSNYRGSAYGIAQQVGVPVPIVEEFQLRYFRAFPAIREWHKLTQRDLERDAFLTTPLPLNRKRHFFGRLTDDSTLREAIAFRPQSTVGELLNLIMLRTWQRSILPFNHPQHLPIELLLQNHDAFLCQTHNGPNLPNVIAALNQLFQSTPLHFTSPSGETRSLVIPGEFVTGFNWGYKDKDEDSAKWTFRDGNPDGLSKWKGADTRTRRDAAHPTARDWLNQRVS